MGHELWFSKSAGWNVDQHFVTAYCAWSNGAVERVNREIIALTRKLLAEKRECLTTWANLMPFIQSTLNQRKSARLVSVRGSSVLLRGVGVYCSFAGR